jgi:hypothetical protein
MGGTEKQPMLVVSKAQNALSKQKACYVQDQSHSHVSCAFPLLCYQNNEEINNKGEMNYNCRKITHKGNNKQRGFTTSYA